MHIRLDDLLGPQIEALLQEHLRDMALHSPPESIHALDLEALRHPDISFWTAWEADQLLGCGALKQLDGGHAEIKSMRTAAVHQRRGVARAVLAHILDEAVRRRYSTLSLETGSAAAFEPARRLYAQHGFTFCAPFGDYIEDPHSVFMTRPLLSAGR